MRKLILFFILSLFFSVAQAQFLELSYLNEQIPSDIRLSYQRDRDFFINTILNKDKEGLLKGLANLSLTKEEKDKALDHLHKVFIFPRKLISSFYIKKNRADTAVTVLDNIPFPQMQLHLPRDEVGFQDYFLELYELDDTPYSSLLTMLWKFEAQGWSLLVLDKGNIKFLGKSRIEFIDQLTANFQSGLPLMVHLGMNYAFNMSAPSIAIKFKDQFEEKYQSLSRSMINFNIKKYLPIVVGSIRVFEVAPIVFNKENTFYPNFFYYGKESVGVNNIANMRKEALSLIPILESVFPGLCKTVEKIYFTSRDPTGRNYDLSMAIDLKKDFFDTHKKK